VIIYLDESGDLGFDFSKRKTSRKFVITLLVNYDRSTATQFKKAVRRTLKNKVNHKKKRKIVPLYITHELSQDNTGLQVVDLFCWGLFRKYESNDTKWYDVFKEAIGFEDEYLK